MKSLFHKIFINHWPRKVISFIIALFVWYVVGQSLSMTKTFSGVQVRVVHLMPGMTVEGLQSNGLLSKRVSVVLTGNKNLLEELSPNDFEILIDATGHEKEWVEEITKKNMVSLSPEINLSGINRISAKNIIVKMTKLYKERIPVIITQPIGEPPRGYQYLDVWPYQLYVSVSGPESEVKKLKTRGVKLTFNLNDVSKSQLDAIAGSSDQAQKDVVSYFVPAHWKTLFLPQISETPLEIDDPDAKFLRIDFVRSELVPIKTPIQIDLFFPLQNGISSLNTNRVQIAPSSLIESRNGLKVLTKPLYAKGVSELFVEVIQDYIEILAIIGRTPSNQYEWSVQFINPGLLEDYYVATLMSDMTEQELSNLQPQVREEYLRNRFRNYMHRFRLYDEEDKPLSLAIELQGNQVIIEEKNANKP